MYNITFEPSYFLYVRMACLVVLFVITVGLMVKFSDQLGDGGVFLLAWVLVILGVFLVGSFFSTASDRAVLDVPAVSVEHIYRAARPYAIPANPPGPHFPKAEGTDGGK